MSYHPLQMKEGFFDRIANGMSKALGSLWATGLYWIGIGVRRLFSILLQFSNTFVHPNPHLVPRPSPRCRRLERKQGSADINPRSWQLYVNTATAIELTFTTMFLQSVRRQQ